MCISLCKYCAQGYLVTVFAWLLRVSHFLDILQCLKLEISPAFTMNKECYMLFFCLFVCLFVFFFERFQSLILKGFCWYTLFTATECLPERDIYWYTTSTGNGGLLVWDVYWYRVFTGKPCLMVRGVYYYRISIGIGVST